MVKTSIRQLLHEAAFHLREAGCESAMLDARLMLQQVMGWDHASLIIHMNNEMDHDDIVLFDAMVARRCQREPLAYIIGHREFWKDTFVTDSRALIPRPESEHLIEAVLARFPDHLQPLRLCDIATGSGCLAISLAREYPQAQVVATDLSSQALTLAEENGARLGVSARMDCRCGDLFAPLAAERFDAIVSNPPYVAAEEMAALAPELAFEPQMALTDHHDGLTLLRRLVAGAAHHLKPMGYLIVETGMCGLPRSCGGLQLEEEINDLAGNLRVGVYRLL